MFRDLGDRSSCVLPVGYRAGQPGRNTLYPGLRDSSGGTRICMWVGIGVKKKTHKLKPKCEGNFRNTAVAKGSYLR